MMGLIYFCRGHKVTQESVETKDYPEIRQVSVCDVSLLIVFEPRHEKTCLRSVRPGNRSAQLMRLARVLKFWR